MTRKDGRPGGPAKSAPAKSATKSASAKFAPRSAAGAPAWSVPLKVDAIPDTGLSRSIEASSENCAAVAKLAEVRAISGLKATFDLSRAGDVVHVTGRVTAHVGQNCVVTLDPLESTIDEAIDVLYAPVPEEGTEAHDAHRRKTEEELPEPLIDGAIDLGAIACEFLILGIEPYPRKPGAAFTPLEVEPDGPHPFAVLAALNLKKNEP